MKTRIGMHIEKKLEITAYRARARRLKATLRQAMVAKRLKANGVTRWFEQCAVYGMNEGKREVYDLLYSDCDKIITEIKEGRRQLAAMIREWRMEKKELRQAISLGNTL